MKSTNSSPKAKHIPVEEPKVVMDKKTIKDEANNGNLVKNINEKKITAIGGGWALFIVLTLWLLAGAFFILSLAVLFPLGNYGLGFTGVATMIILTVVLAFSSRGFKLLQPNEAHILMFFGKYVGTLSRPGFYYVNPFYGTYTSKLSLKAITLNNQIQKVNDEIGNPIEIGVIVIWKVVDTAKAVFNVENYAQYVSTQTDASIRQVARQYPYDDVNDNDGVEKSLRGSSNEVCDQLRKDLQSRVILAGVEILEARIAHLAYAPEIATVMLQRQQASAVIQARGKIVEGAVGMVKMAIDKLEKSSTVKLSNLERAQLVSNLLVVLVSNKDAQPVINNGSSYRDGE